MSFERDCNTCDNHIQGCLNVPSECRQCLTITGETFGVATHLPFWVKKKENEVTGKGNVEEAVTSKPTNPKDLIGSGKLPLHLWPSTATAMGSVGMLNGMLKYGRSNFRAVGVRASIYVDAAKRHLDAWFEGEECDPDDGVPHLAAALSCIAIIVDADAAGKLTDDRATKGGYRELMAQLTPHVARLKALHAGKAPKHYTIEDSHGSI